MTFKVSNFDIFWKRNLKNSVFLIFRVFKLLPWYHLLGSTIPSLVRVKKVVLLSYLRGGSLRVKSLMKESLMYFWNCAFIDSFCGHIKVFRSYWFKEKTLPQAKLLITSFTIIKFYGQITFYGNFSKVFFIRYHHSPGSPPKSQC